MDRRIAIIRAVVATAIVVPAVIESIKVSREERAKREQIRLDHEKEMRAIYAASAIVHEKVRNGEYNGKFSSIRPDLEFYRMAARFED